MRLSGGADGSPAIAVDGTVYFAGEDLYAVNPHTGEEEWCCAIQGWTSGGPAIGDDGTVYVITSEGALYAVSPNGSEMWDFQTGGWTYDASAAIGEDGTIYLVTQDDEKLYAINPDGSRKWSVEIPVANGTPAVGLDGTIYVAGRCLHAINPDGSERWSFASAWFVRMLGGPAIGGDGTVYVGSSEGAGKRLLAIRPDGTERWRFHSATGFGTSPVIGQGGVLYVGGASQESLYAIESNVDGRTDYWALLVGVDCRGDCGGILEADAESMEQHLLAGANWESDYIQTLIGPQATWDELKSAIRQMASRVDGDDVFLFFYSGHGGHGGPDLAWPIDEPDARDGGICLYGGNQPSDDFLSDELAQVSTEKFCAIIQSCYSGEHIRALGTDGQAATHSTSGRALGRTATMEVAIPERTSMWPLDLDDRGRGVVITSVAEDEMDMSAQWNFTSVVTRGLEGPADSNANGWISGQELYGYVRGCWLTAQMYQNGEELEFFQLPLAQLEHTFAAGLQMIGLPLYWTYEQTMEDLAGDCAYAGWDATSQTYETEASPTPIPDVAEGYWARFPSARRLDVRATPYPEGQLTCYAYEGWNLIALPWCECLDVSAMSSDPPDGVLRYAWTYYDGCYHLVSPIGGILGVTKEFEPWRSYWVFAEDGCYLTLDRETASASTEDMSIGDRSREDVWLIQVVASVDAMVDPANYCGISPRGDALDVPNPPPAWGGVDLYFTSQTGAHKALDFCAARPGGTYEWDFEVVAPATDQQVAVACPDLSSVPNEYKVYLVDRDADKTVYMRTTSSYQYTASSDAPRHLTLRVVAEADRPLMVSRVTVQQANSATAAMSYALATGANVTVEVHNIAGRRVRRIVDGEPTAPGIQTVTWNLRGDGGRLVPRGLYLLRVTARAEDGRQASALATVSVRR